MMQNDTAQEFINLCDKNLHVSNFLSKKVLQWIFFGSLNKY